MLDALQQLGNHFFPDPNLTMSVAQQNIHNNVEELLRTSPDVNYINEITEDELHLAIFTTAGKKAPGINGIQA